MTHRYGWLFLLALLMASPLQASETISRYVYEESGIFPIRTGLGIATTIELDQNDPVLDYSTGFSGGWEIVRREHLFYIKPKNVDVDTNLLIRTQRRAYIFELQVVATDWRKLDEVRRKGVQYRVVFDYADAKTDERLDEELELPAPEPPVEAAKSMHYDYELSTKTERDWLVPTSVYDDGGFTYIRLPNPGNIPSGNWPTVYARNARHEEDFVINSNVESDTIVVHGVYPFLVLRHGDQAVGLRRNPAE
jgi:type IV secretion system protein VirB9